MSRPRVSRHTSDGIGQRHGRRAWLLVAVTHNGRQPAHGFDARPIGHEVLVRSRDAVARHGDVDDVGIELCEDIPSKAHRCHGPGAEIVDDHIGCCDEL